MSWSVKLPPVLRPQGVSLGGSGVSVGGVRILRADHIFCIFFNLGEHQMTQFFEESCASRMHL